MKVSIITIGTEILIGQIVDTNSAWLGKALNEQGAEIESIISIADDYEQMLFYFNQCSKKSDLVIITGGLGPTKDDFTKNAIADFLDVNMTFNVAIYNQIVAYFEARNYPLSKHHKDQCYFPEEVELLENKRGTAPGMFFQKNGCSFFATPGVPMEMKYVFENHIKNWVSERSEQLIYHRTLHTCGRGESLIADDIEDLIHDLPKELSIAYLPSKGSVRIRISGKHTDLDWLKGLIDNKIQQIEERLQDIVFGKDDTNLVKEVIELLKEKNLKLCTAESCTGGKVASMITEIAGVSQIYLGSMVAYDNKIKSDQLLVSEKTLKMHGAVSTETTEEMVKGALQKFGADIAVAISGIAGPSGGTASKPVGTVCISCGNKDNIISKKFLFKNDRKINIAYSSAYTFIMLRKFILTL